MLVEISRPPGAVTALMSGSGVHRAAMAGLSEELKTWIRLERDQGRHSAVPLISVG